MDNTAATYMLGDAAMPRARELAAQPARHDAELSAEDMIYRLDAVDTLSGTAGDITPATPVTVDAVIDGRTRQLSVRGVRCYLNRAGEAQVVITAS